MGPPINVYKILDELEVAQCRESFLKFDADASGTIDQYELKTVLNSMGQNPTDEELQAMIFSVDDNDSGSIDFHEFLCIFAQHKLDAQNAGAEDDVLLAWKAVGGGGEGEGEEAEKEGTVDTAILSKIIKDDFQ